MCVEGDDKDELRQKKAIIENSSAFATSTLSTSSRYIGYGVIALTYTILSSEDSFNNEILNQNRIILFSAAFFAIFAIVLDYIQYVAFHFVVNEAKDNYKSRENIFSAGIEAYKTAQFCFAWKQVASISSALCVLIIFLSYAFSSL